MEALPVIPSFQEPLSKRLDNDTPLTLLISNRHPSLHHQENGHNHVQFSIVLLLLLLLLLSCFSCVQLCATPWTAAHQEPPSLGFSRQEHWSGLPFLSPMHERKSESEVAQLCPTLCDPMDCSPPGSSIHGIFQARVLEWGAIAFSSNAGHLCSIPGPGRYHMPRSN